MEVDRVQAIASDSFSTGTIPPEYIRQENEQPGITTFKGQQPEVPVIDFANEEKLVELILDASSKWGVFQIVNHVIPKEVINRLQKVGKEFFELPKEDKELYAKSLRENDSKNSVEGYGTKLQKEAEGKRGWVDHLFNMIWPPSAIDYRFWPKNPPDYREATEEYAKHLHNVVHKVLGSISLGLGLEENELKYAMGGDDLVYNLKINYYPPCPCPDLALGVPAHTDMCAITILVPNEVQGLRAYEEGHWVDVKYVANALVVHIGDQIEILSNGRCRSMLHRSTVNKENTRMSWPVFVEPPADRHVFSPSLPVAADASSSAADFRDCKVYTPSYVEDPIHISTQPSKRPTSSLDTSSHEGLCGSKSTRSSGDPFKECATNMSRLSEMHI
ncbi:hypothetical protein ACH5RR_026310 [Cinchona calisaya]|uniref:Fe2OG dioxygenase domain-containing protein n=1 Tax=Cinchona calisaya TaxID=153742 RepID=A0ABD2Z3A1_9GENT